MEEDLMVAHDAAKHVCVCFWIAIGGVESAISSEMPKEKSIVQSRPNQNEHERIDSMLQRGTPTKETESSVKKEEESWRKSEAAHREWLQSQKAPQKNGSVSGPTSLVNALELRRMQLVHEHWSKPQQSNPPKDSCLASKDMEDWKKSEAAHRQWLKSLEK